MFGIFNNKVKTESKGKVISLLNQKGGVGKTTMAFHTAHALAKRGHRILCIDMDPQSNFSMLFDGLGTEFNIGHLLINSLKELKPLHTPAFINQTIIHEPSGHVGIDLIPAGQYLSGFELSVAAINSPRQLILKNFIEKNQLKEIYDFIIIDGPPTLGLIVVNILCASDGVLIPFQPDQFSRLGLSHFQEVLSDVEDMGITSAPKVIGYIPNLVDQRRKQAHKDFEKIYQDLDQGYIFDSFTNKVQLVKASAQKKSVFAFRAKEYAEIQKQFMDLAHKIEQDMQS